MAKPKVTIKLDRANGNDVHARFMSYGGTEKDWRWIRQELDKMDGHALEAKCRKLEKVRRCERLVHGSCVVLGQLDVVERVLWEDGVVDGVFLVEAILMRDFERQYFADQFAGVPPQDQLV
jgi:hypothetical protein